MTYLVRVDAVRPNAVFGFDVVDGVVANAAPIACWMNGKRGKDMVGYWRKRGATVSWELVPQPEPVKAQAKGKKVAVLA